MKVMLEFSEYELRQMVLAHLAKESLVPKGKTASVGFKYDMKYVSAFVEITDTPPSSYHDR